MKKIFIIIFTILFFVNSFAQEDILIKDITKAREVENQSHWYVPDYVKIQFAGNIGLISVGIGYDFFDSIWLSELLYGFVPASVSEAKQIHLITSKNTFPILTRAIGKNLTISPIVGFTATLETGNNSFLKIPDVFPGGYYITNAIHFTLFTGASFHKEFTNSTIFKGADLYFEVGTIDTYLWYAITAKEIGVNDIFSSSVGINLYI
ncbi:MAG: hypothetical protein QMB86_02620 [Polaribacter sp.]|jgi:hypothetical protein|tara:strand:+ start:883 stop:1503 length:621 start_codon:yes stop_codon:yes gene_type:complete